MKRPALLECMCSIPKVSWDAFCVFWWRDTSRTIARIWDDISRNFQELFGPTAASPPSQEPDESAQTNLSAGVGQSYGLQGGKILWTNFMKPTHASRLSTRLTRHTEVVLSPTQLGGISSQQLSYNILPLEVSTARYRKYYSLIFFFPEALNFLSYRKQTNSIITHH